VIKGDKRMVIAFVTADVAGVKILSHQLPLIPIYNIMKNQGYDCRWAQWHSPWGKCNGVNESDIQCYVTGDEGIRDPEKTKKTFYHPHGLHPRERSYYHTHWYGCLTPGEYWFSHINRKGEFVELDNGKIDFDLNNLSKMPITGWAKMDVLFQKNKEEIISEYKLKLPYEKTVLYAPAGNWDYATSFDKSIEHIINLFSKLPYNLIIKNAIYSGSFEKWEYFINVMKNPPSNMTTIMNPVKQITSVEAKTPDITPLYKIADLLITDGSSVAWEFIGVDKPAIQLNNMIDPISSLMQGPCGSYCDIEKEKGVYRYDSKYGESKVVNEFEECKACGGVIKSSLNELEPNVVDAIEYPNRYASIRRNWAKTVNAYVDGKCAQRCVDAIKRIAEI